MAMEIGHLRYVVATAEAGSFRRAASLLEVRQSSISRGIQQLEDELGVSLFVRRRSGAHLTLAGERFLREARPALEQLHLARRAAEAAGRVETGVVRIGILTSLGGGFLRQLVASYARHHPEITLDVHDGSRRDHFAAVRAHRLDAAFVTGTEPVEDCEVVELWHERVHVALPACHALAGRPRLDWPELRHEHFIVSRAEPGPEVHDYIVRRAAGYGTYPQIEPKATLQETVMNLVGLGQGITLVSAAWTAMKLPDLVLRPLIDDADVVPFSMVWSAGNDNPALRRLLSIAHMLARRPRKGCSDWLKLVNTR